MTSILSFLVVGAVMVFVGWPLFRGRPSESVALTDGDSRSPLERDKQEAYAAIKEAEFDLRMGKLSEDDFKSLEQRYRQQALAAIVALEKAGARGRTAKAPVAGVPQPSRYAFCPACGNRLTARANFCAACGHSLRDAVA
jgi:hypothetical protein